MSIAKAFVTNCQHDVFVSYAHVDDVPSLGAETGWVTALIRGLKTSLAQQLGRSDGFSVWMDYELSRHSPITPEILAALEQSATLLIVLSPGYMASEWCQREKDGFLATARRRQDQGFKVFVVERMRLERDRWPPELADLRGYRFWVQDEEGRAPRTLGDPVPDPRDRRFHDMLNDLAHDVAGELRKLAAASQTTATAAASPPADDRMAVFLAEVTDDIDHLRNATRRHLQQAGLKVLPESWYPRDPARFRAAMERDLDVCRLFVQLLSHVAGKKTPDLPQGYPGLQHEIARATELPILQWRSRELDLSAIEDGDHCRRLAGPTVLAMGIEEFKQEVEERALETAEAPPLEPIDAFVFVDVESADRPLARSVCQVLDHRQVGYALPLQSGQPAEIRKDLRGNLLDCDALIVIYGTTPTIWVREQLQLLRKVLPRREQPLKALGVYEGPPSDKPPLDFKLPRMRILDCRDGRGEAELQEFLDSINGAEA